VSFNDGSINSSENDCIGIGKSKTNFNQVPITTGGFCIGTDADVHFNSGELNITNGNLFTDESVVNFDNMAIVSVQAIDIRNNSNVSFRNGTTLNAGSGDGNLQINRSDVEIRDLNLANLNISGGSVNLHDAIIINEQGHALEIGGGADVNFQRGSIRESDDTCISIGGAKAHFNEVPITTGGFCIGDSDVYIGSGSVTLTNGTLFANGSKLNMNNLPLSITNSLGLDGSKAYFDNVTIDTQNVHIGDSDVRFNNGSITRDDDGCIGIHRSKAHFNTVNVTSGSLCISGSDIHFSNGPLALTNGSMIIDRGTQATFDNLSLDLNGEIEIEETMNTRFESVEINANQIRINAQANVVFDDSVISTQGGNLAISGGSFVRIENTEFSADTEQAGIDLNSSKIELINSSIESIKTWTDASSNQIGSDAIVARNNSKISILLSDTSVTNIDAGARPIFAEESSVDIGSKVQFSSVKDANQIQMQSRGKLGLGGYQNVDIGKISLGYDSEAHIGGTWSLEYIYCSNVYDGSNNAVYRHPVVYQNGASITDKDGSCIMITD